MDRILYTFFAEKVYNRGKLLGFVPDTSISSEKE